MRYHRFKEILLNANSANECALLVLCTDVKEGLVLEGAFYD